MDITLKYPSDLDLELDIHLGFHLDLKLEIDFDLGYDLNFGLGYDLDFDLEIDLCYTWILTSRLTLAILNSKYTCAKCPQITLTLCIMKVLTRTAFSSQILYVMS